MSRLSRACRRKSMRDFPADNGVRYGTVLQASGKSAPGPAPEGEGEGNGEGGGGGPTEEGQGDDEQDKDDTGDEEPVCSICLGNFVRTTACKCILFFATRMQTPFLLLNAFASLADLAVDGNAAG